MTALRAIGVDLSAGAAHTAICTVTVQDAALLVQAPLRPVDDDLLLEVLTSLAPGDVLGLDCPFGWPLPFVQAVAAHAECRPWPHRHMTGDQSRAAMRLRDTDRHTATITGRMPLSVSADKLGATAMRAAHVLDQAAYRLGVPALARDGSGAVIEVYPAASRRVWGLDPAARDLDVLEAQARLQFAPAARAGYVNEHCFDALIAALTARAHQVGLTAPVQPEHAEAAAVEGWIVLPLAGSLSRLAAEAG